MDTFTFPKRDYLQHLTSLKANNGFGQSIRVSAEANRYLEGNVYSSVFGRLLVLKIVKYSSFSQLHINELTSVQKKILAKYDSFAVIYFRQLFK
jgi:hypothetical protein